MAGTEGFGEVLAEKKPRGGLSESVLEAGPRNRQGGLSFSTTKQII